MIPTDRPVHGKDLDTVRQQLGLLTSDACWLFGLSMTRWMQTVRQAPDLPVKDPTLALLVRFLDAHPESCPLPKFPGVPEMFELVNSAQETGQKKFAVLMGSEGTSTYRWMSGGSRQSPGVLRLMFCLKQALLARTPEKRTELLEAWGKTVAAEGVSRGEADVFTSGKWNLKGVDEVREKIKSNQPENERLLRKKGLALKAPERQAAKELLVEMELQALRSTVTEALMTAVLEEKKVDGKVLPSEPGTEPAPRRRRTNV